MSNGLALPPGARKDPIEVKRLPCNVAQPVVATVPTPHGTMEVRIYGGLTPLQHVAALLAGDSYQAMLVQFHKTGDDISDLLPLCAKAAVDFAQAILDECAKREKEVNNG